MKKIKVLHIYKTSIEDSFGGIETFIHNLCEEGEDLGIKNLVMTLSPNSKNKEVNMGKYKIIKVKQDLNIFQTSFSLKAIFKFKELVKDADIIHYHFPYPFADLLHFLCAVKKPSIITYHSDIIRQKRVLIFYKWLMKRFLNSVDCIVATSENYFATSEILKNVASKVRVIPIGINVKKYPNFNIKKNKKFCEKLPKKFLVFIGAMRYYKGLKIALKAVENTNINLVLAGIGQIEEELKEIVYKRKMNNVYFLGKVSEEEKVCLLNLCTGFVFPSHLRSEAFGISLLEAASFSNPLISCEIGTGTSYVNKNNVTGIVVKPSDPSQLQKAMYFLLNNSEKANEMGKNAKKRAMRLFKSDKATRDYLKLYKEIIKKKNK